MHLIGLTIFLHSILAAMLNIRRVLPPESRPRPEQ
jgi:hypothetical protein